MRQMQRVRSIFFIVSNLRQKYKNPAEFAVYTEKSLIFEAFFETPYY
jgi:hypothetical protein